MKKTILFTLMVMISMSMSAQRVIPITFKLTEFNLDTMRATYQGSAYLLELQRLDKLMKDDSKMLSDLQKQLKKRTITNKCPRMPTRLKVPSRVCNRCRKKS